MNDSNSPEQKEPGSNGSDKAPPGLWQVVQSVMAAFFGVQSDKNRERDFSRGRPMQYIVIGLVATALFVLTIVTIVKLVLKQAGM